MLRRAPASPILRPVTVALLLGAALWAAPARADAPALHAATDVEAPRAAPGAAAPRRNLLLVLTDDQRADATGGAGRFPFLETPQLDQLAADGTSFENAMVVTSLCSPSRATILTSTYAHRHGVWTNDLRDPDPSLPTFPQLLQQAGYATAWVGKWHIGPSAEPRPGFDYWLSFAGHGRYRDPELDENGRRFVAEGYLTDILTEHAARWLSEGRPADAPFALVLSHKAPHAPYAPAPRHADAFRAATLPRPPSAQDDLADKPAWVRHLAVYGDYARPWGWRLRGLPEALPPSEPWVGDRAQYVDYLRTLLAVDESLGRILALLDARGELENTLVVFTSDNGYLLGEHRLTNKMLMYEPSIRVPLVLRGPSLPAGAERHAIVTNLDIAPTLLDAAGVPVPESFEGRSLLPLARDPALPGRDALFYEYFHTPELPAIPDHTGVRTERWKYIRSGEGDRAFEELYDLAHDPDELANLAGNPAHREVLDAMRERLARAHAETGYTDPAPGVARGEGLRWWLRHAKREVVFQWRQLSRQVIAWLRPLKDWLAGVLGIAAGASPGGLPPRAAG